MDEFIYSKWRKREDIFRELGKVFSNLAVQLDGKKENIHVTSDFDIPVCLLFSPNPSDPNSENKLLRMQLITSTLKPILQSTQSLNKITSRTTWDVENPL